MLTPFQVILTMGTVLILLFVLLDRAYYRKIIHIVTGYTFTNFFVKSTHCNKWISILPFGAVIGYVISLRIPKLNFIPSTLGKNGKFHSTGIIVYGILMGVLPFTGCAEFFSKALICVCSGDGCAGMAEFCSMFGFKLPWNKKKSYLGMMLCYLGSLFGLYLFNGEIDHFSAVIASIAESVDLEEDNLVVFLLVYMNLFAPVRALICVFTLHLAIMAAKHKMLTIPASVLGMVECIVICSTAPVQVCGLILFAILGLMSSSYNKYYGTRNGLMVVAEHEEKEFMTGRGVNSVLSNSLPQLICAALSLILPNYTEKLTLASLAASAECLADTFGSDFGSVLGKSTRHPLLLRKEVPKGVNGGVSFVGSLFGFCGALFVSELSILVTHDYHDVFFVLAAALIGFYIDSVLGILCQYSGILSNGQIVNTPHESSRNVGGLNILSNGAVNCLSCSLSSMLYFIFSFV